MALARSLARPLWICKSCRSNLARAFTTSGTLDLPRQNRRVVDAPKTLHHSPRSSEGQATLQPLHVFEDDALSDSLKSWSPELEDEPRGPPPSEQKNPTAQKSKLKPWSPELKGEPQDLPPSEQKSPTAQKSKVRWKSDGISNVSNKHAGTNDGGAKTDLSIPWEILADEPPEPAETSRTKRSEQFTGVHQPKVHKDVKPEEAPLLQELPWYLRPEYSAFVPVPSSPFTERQHLPDLPELPPVHLQEILEHLYKEQGLEYLTLLDLRSLDPPPALGNQLMMIIATARGEKHLHIAAARFASHLRRTYDLSPYTDGLVGRRENQIQKRRKLKKARALANVGHTDPLREIEEGLATSWVCVRAGYLDPHPDAPRRKPYRPTGMIGFGQESNKITLVVQLFTEERRATVDLEGLWGKLLEKSRLRSEGREQEIEPDDAAAEGLIDAEEVMDARKAELKQRKARARFGFDRRLDPLFDAAMEDVPPEAGNVASS